MSSETRKQHEQDLLDLLIRLRCPCCELNYTEFAMLWGLAYVQGRIDVLEELGTSERNDTMKIMCELCHTISRLCLLSGEVQPMNKAG